MKLLPEWILTSGLPAFRDGESKTAIEQTYKLYQAMQQLIVEYNAFVEHVVEENRRFKEEYQSDIEIFTTEMRQEFQDFIDVVELKLSDVAGSVGEELNIPELTAEVESMKDQLTALETKVNDEIATQLTALENKVNEEVETKINALETKVNNEVATQIAGAKTYTDEQITALRNEIIADLEGDY